jgi:hypothetical protein
MKEGLIHMVDPSWFRVCEERTAKLGDVRWRMHMNDKDRWPSYPHAHDLDEPQKLNLFTGIIYSIITKNRVGKLSRKELKEVHRQLQWFPPEETKTPAG